MGGGGGGGRRGRSNSRGKDDENEEEINSLVAIDRYRFIAALAGKNFP